MANDMMLLKDAGVREREWAKQLLAEGRLPRAVTFEDMLASAVYDAHADEVSMAVVGDDFRWVGHWEVRRA